MEHAFSSSNTYSGVTRYTCTFSLTSLWWLRLMIGIQSAFPIRRVAVDQEPSLLAADQYQSRCFSRQSTVLRPLALYCDIYQVEYLLYAARFLHDPFGPACIDGWCCLSWIVSLISRSILFASLDYLCLRRPPQDINRIQSMYVP